MREGWLACFSSGIAARRCIEEPAGRKERRHSSGIPKHAIFLRVCFSLLLSGKIVDTLGFIRSSFLPSFLPSLSLFLPLARITSHGSDDIEVARGVEHVGIESSANPYRDVTRGCLLFASENRTNAAPGVFAYRYGEITVAHNFRRYWTSSCFVKRESALSSVRACVHMCVYARGRELSRETVAIIRLQRDRSAKNHLDIDSRNTNLKI